MDLVKKIRELIEEGKLYEPTTERREPLPQYEDYEPNGQGTATDDTKERSGVKTIITGKQKTHL